MSAAEAPTTPEFDEASPSYRAHCCCCKCCHVTLASKIILALAIIGSVLSIGSSSYALSLANQHSYILDDADNRAMTLTLYSIQLILSVYCLVAASLAFVGMEKVKPTYTIPIIVGQIFGLVFGIAVLVGTLITGLKDTPKEDVGTLLASKIGGVIGIGFGIWFLMVLIQLYGFLKDKASHQTAASEAENAKLSQEVPQDYGTKAKGLFKGFPGFGKGDKK